MIRVMVETKLTYDKYMESIRNNKLTGLRCNSCGKVITPPKHLCPNCKSEDLDIIELSGKGKIKTYTIIRVPPPKFAKDAPYTAAIVELDEGPCVTARIIGLASDKVSIGQRVKMNHLEKDDEIELVFNPQ